MRWRCTCQGQIERWSWFVLVLQLTVQELYHWSRNPELFSASALELVPLAFSNALSAECISVIDTQKPMFLVSKVPQLLAWWFVPSTKIWLPLRAALAGPSRPAIPTPSFRLPSPSLKLLLPTATVRIAPRPIAKSAGPVVAPPPTAHELILQHTPKESK